LGLRIL